MSVELLCLQVVADVDAGALLRVLERFQNLNVLPRRVIAEFGTSAIHIQVDIVGLPEGKLSLIAAKLGQVPCIVDARWWRA